MSALAIRGRALPLMLLVLWLVGCATAPKSARTPSAAEIEDRSQQLAELQRWRLSGRVAVSHAGDGGSGSVTWTHSPERAEFELRAPVTGRSWKLVVESDQARIEGLDEGPRSGADAQQLVRETVGWELPLPTLAYWVRGLPAPGPADVQYDVNGLPEVIEQQGWRIEYRDWTEFQGHRLPRKLFASRADQRLRLVIGRWQAGL